MSGRVYLDWNATAPLRPEARAAMAAALDLVGNPSSVHAEGRAARGAVERARAQVAALLGCAPEQVIFTSGATEANALALHDAPAALYAPTGHASLIAAARRGARPSAPAPLASDGRLDLRETAARAWRDALGRTEAEAVFAFEAANGETGLTECVGAVTARLGAAMAEGLRLAAHCDVTQAVGRVPFRFEGSGLRSAALSAHKIGGPKGVGALIHAAAAAPRPLIEGGGQERGWRAGTENVVGIVGFGAAAEAAARDLADGVWERAALLRDDLEARVPESNGQTICVGGRAPRLPNTSCLLTRGWRGETQVMQFDLAGAAVSSGSACSSGKVGESHVLRALGHGDAAGCAIRVSIGPTTTQQDIDRFCAIWDRLNEKRRAKAA